MIIKGVCKCDIDLIQQLINKKLILSDLILSDYNTMSYLALFRQQK